MADANDPQKPAGFSGSQPSVEIKPPQEDIQALVDMFFADPENVKYVTEIIILMDQQKVRQPWDPKSNYQDLIKKQQEQKEQIEYLQKKINSSINIYAQYSPQGTAAEVCKALRDGSVGTDPAAWDFLRPIEESAKTVNIYERGFRGASQPINVSRRVGDTVSPVPVTGQQPGATISFGFGQAETQTGQGQTIQAAAGKLDDDGKHQGSLQHDLTGQLASVSAEKEDEKKKVEKSRAPDFLSVDPNGTREQVELQPILAQVEASPPEVKVEEREEGSGTNSLPSVKSDLEILGQDPRLDAAEGSQSAQAVALQDRVEQGRVASNQIVMPAVPVKQPGFFARMLGRKLPEEVDLGQHHTDFVKSGNLTAAGAAKLHTAAVQHRSGEAIPKSEPTDPTRFLDQELGINQAASASVNPTDIIKQNEQASQEIAA